MGVVAGGGSGTNGVVAGGQLGVLQDGMEAITETRTVRRGPAHFLLLASHKGW